MDSPCKDGNGRVGAHCSIAHWRRTKFIASLPACRHDSNQCVTNTTTRSLPFPPLCGRHHGFMVPGPGRNAARASERGESRDLKAQFWVRNSELTLNERQKKALNVLLDARATSFVGGITNNAPYSQRQVLPRLSARLSELVEKGAWYGLEPAGARYELPKMENPPHENRIGVGPFALKSYHVISIKRADVSRTDAEIGGKEGIEPSTRHYERCTSHKVRGIRSRDCWVEPRALHARSRSAARAESVRSRPPSSCASVA
jgi:hypothetical protein